MDIVETYIKRASRKIEEEIYEDRPLIESMIVLCSAFEDLVQERKTIENEGIEDSAISEFYRGISRDANEVLLGILINSRIAAASVLRSIVENFVIFQYIKNSSEKKIERYLYWPAMQIEKELQRSKFWTEETTEKIKGMKRELSQKIKENVLAEKQEKTFLEILKNKYGWAYEWFNLKDKITFSKLCKKMNLNEQYKRFQDLSSAVHSNTTMDKFQNSIFSYEYIVYYFVILVACIESYTEDAIERYEFYNDDVVDELYTAIETANIEVERIAKEIFKW